MLGLVVVAVVVVGFFAKMKFAGGSEEQESYTPYTVGTMTLRAMVTSAGVAVAQDEAVLSFQKPGQLEEVMVGLGDKVREGQPLMRIKSDDLENAAASAQSALSLAQLRLQQLQEGATDADLAKADGVVASAQAGLTKAENDLKTALDPATDAHMTAAQQAVAMAEANLAAAEAKLNALKDGASDADLAAAQAAVTQAQAKLDQATNGVGQANSAKDSAQGFLQVSRDQLLRYC